MATDDPLDFESEDRLLKSPALTKRRKKVIGLDDLVNDYLKENKKQEMKSKRAKAQKKLMGQISSEEEICLWGLQVFGNHKTLPHLAFHELGGCGLLQSFMHNELDSLVELDINKGEAFLESLLISGWLLKLLDACGHVEKSIATWTYNLMLHSVQEVLSASACDFWISILSPKTKIKIDWLPNYSEIKKALEIYGFLSDFPSRFSSDVEMVNAGKLLGLSVILHKCMLSAISFFTDNEWNTSSEEVAKSIACRVPKDMNCLRTVESISGVDARSKQLRRAMAFRILVACLDIKATDAEEILRFLNLINVKDKSCDLFKIYIYLVLTENWLLYNPALEDKPVIHKLWGVYLRQCSCQITSTDLRTYASKVCSKASYLLQGINNK
ncbi:hypothetical protein RHMOL_Rhmol11G0077000 [Rhododendron molle]|uniref:Uncharacterized protein n=2 Tax=Rhododendron molle TaxID=49168 RepID=A0ACC0LQT5_RHOML|nr:hypothetical protein RHMOL_Rhmol11G0077000 [Rhododendron molle]KAI8530662.1 hypothetical protein RHMOL_Rhmol11G0077000 [Rhododendron molle]